ncbi:MAG: response regulator [Rhodospirillales bacterium]
MAKILIIDDDPFIRLILRRILEKEGYEVVETDDGGLAVDLQKEHGTDVLIVDMVMPKKNGMDVIADMKAAFPDIDIIAMSGDQQRGEENVFEKAIETGAAKTLLKPITADTLLAAVEACLARR